MNIKVHKYAACGNDFVIIDEKDNQFDGEAVSRLAPILCDRHNSVGCDSVLLLQEKEGKFLMRILEKDGSESDMCGNGIRCAADYLMSKHSLENYVEIVTRDNILRKVEKEGGLYKVDMGTCGPVNGYLAALPEKSKGELGFIETSTEPKLEKNIVSLGELGFIETGIESRYSKGLEISNAFLVNTGEPHLVFIAKDISRIELQKVGDAISCRRDIFPKSVNVNIAEIVNEKVLLRTYERGIFAETQCCGTGSTAAAYIAREMMKGKPPSIEVVSRGGSLEISFLEERMFMKGPAKKLFDGVIEL